MFDLPVLDFTISIVFVFFLFSLFAAALLELVNTVRKRRARILRDALDKVMNDPQNKNFAELIYNHPIIEASRKDPDSLPSYISAENFATALIAVITEQGRQVKIGMNVTNTAQEVKSDTTPPGTPIEQFRAGLKTLEPSSFQQLMVSLSQFVNDLGQLEKKLITWYNGYMDRVSGWFKRKSHKILMLLSAVVVIGCYVDFFHLASEFWNNDKLRTQIVQSAVATVENGQKPNDPTQLNNIQGQQVTNIDSLKSEIRNRYNAAEEVYDDIMKKNLPVGWKVAGKKWCWDDGCLYTWESKNGFFGELWNKIKLFFNHIGGVILNLLALLISILAISRGAPFWFDTLNKLVNLRSSGKKPQVAPEK